MPTSDNAEIPALAIDHTVERGSRVGIVGAASHPQFNGPDWPARWRTYAPSELRLMGRIAHDHTLGPAGHSGGAQLIPNSVSPHFRNSLAVDVLSPRPCPAGASGIHWSLHDITSVATVVAE